MGRLDGKVALISGGARGQGLPRRGFLPASGSIINISSVAGLVGNPNGSPAYTATKGAVRLFTKATAVQHARDHIRCNSVHPGPIETEMLKEAAGGLEETYRRRVPLGRFGATEDIAYGVLYLASDESSCVTGSELVIDGGSTAQ